MCADQLTWQMAQRNVTMVAERTTRCASELTHRGTGHFRWKAVSTGWVGRESGTIGAPSPILMPVGRAHQSGEVWAACQENPQYRWAGRRRRNAQVRGVLRRSGLNQTWPQSQQRQCRWRVLCQWKIATVTWLSLCWHQEQGSCVARSTSLGEAKYRSVPQSKCD